MTAFVKREYTLELVTPAFLGGANQSAEWRTPGIKALIRQWWRVAYVARHGVDVKKMREDEGRLFGTVNDSEKKARRAQVSLRFSALPSTDTMKIGPKVDDRDRSQALPYLAYGPFESPMRSSNRTALKDRSSVRLTVICQGESARRSEQISEDMEQVLWLINRFGTLGSRSNNGWGSLKLSGLNISTDLNTFTRPFNACLQQDWVTGVARDQHGAMVWTTPARPDWKQVMQDLKIMRKDLQNKHAKTRRKRFMINGPADGNTKRWPNQFVFKVLPTTRGFTGQIVLLAHQWPATSSEELAKLMQEIAAKLDADAGNFKRVQT